MKKLLLMSAVLVLAACGGEQREAGAPPAETTGEMATPADTGMAGMSHDTAMTQSDTTMARDTAK